MAQYTNKNRLDLTIEADTVSDPLHIPEGASNITFTLLPGTSADLEYTTSSKDKIVANTAIWIEWTAGSVTIATRAEYSGTMSGVRASAVTTGAILEVMWT